MAQGDGQPLRRPWWLQIPSQSDGATVPSSDPASQYFQALHEVMTLAGGDSAVRKTQSPLEHLCNLVRKEKTKQFSHSENEGVTQEGHPSQPRVIREGFLGGENVKARTLR